MQYLNQAALFVPERINHVVDLLVEPFLSLRCTVADFICRLHKIPPFRNTNQPTAKLKNASNANVFEFRIYLTFLHLRGIIADAKATTTPTEMEETSCERNLCRWRDTCVSVWSGWRCLDKHLFKFVDYTFLLREYRFQRAVIPMDPRNSGKLSMKTVRRFAHQTVHLWFCKGNPAAKTLCFAWNFFA